VRFSEYVLNRRYLLTKIVQGFSLTGGLFLAYPFVRSWLPGFNQSHTREVDLSDLAFGEVKQVPWLGRRVMIKIRSTEEVEALSDASVSLKDPDSTRSKQPEFARNTHRSQRADIFVAYGNCTHFGCIVEPRGPNSPAKFSCPCHLSEFDAAGRVFADAVAPKNLEIPDYQFLSRNTLLLTSSD
jgi:ubiquinol-cytochrome c reductase iron-sulfur subunit